jgi:hypothetical protein
MGLRPVATIVPSTTLPSALSAVASSHQGPTTPTKSPTRINAARAIMSHFLAAAGRRFAGLPAPSWADRAPEHLESLISTSGFTSQI